LKNSKREILLNALLTHPTVREASVAAGISESAIYTWLKKDDFKAELNERRSELVIDTKNYLQSRLMETADVIFKIMNDKAAAPQTRLNAANAAFANALKLIEQADILTRLDALETALKEDNGS